MRRLLLGIRVGLVVGLVIGAGFGTARYVRSQQGQPPGNARAGVRIEPTAVSVRILLGRKDTAPTAWDGSLLVTDGSLLRLEGWRFRQGDRLTSPTGWKAMSRRAAVGAGQAQRQGANAPVVPNGLFVTLQGSGQTDVKLTTSQGDFHFHLAEIEVGKPLVFLDGAVSVERALPDFQLTSAPTEDDFPAAAAGKDGTLWIAYVAYQYGQGQLPTVRALQQEPASFDFLKMKGNGDQVMLAKIAPDGAAARFSVVESLTPPGQDVLRPAVATDTDGNVWVVWSQNVQGNWQLVARRYRDGHLSDPLKITTGGGPNLMPALARDDQGTVWLTWQGFRNDKSAIFLTSVANGSDRWAKPLPVSDSPQNNWDPAIACAHDGSLYVAWDTYDQGDYDVRMRRIRTDSLRAGNRPEDSRRDNSRRDDHQEAGGDVIAVANTPRFEARVSLACDAQSRAWVAYESGSERWGKDFGYLIKNQGTPLYREHTVAVRCYVDGKPFHTAGDLSDSFQAGVTQPTVRARPGAPPAQGPQRSFPRLGTDGQGRVFLTYRQPAPALQAPIGTTWLSFVTTYAGNAWTPAEMVPNSDGLLDNRPVILAGGANGPLYLIHASDGRNHAFGSDPRTALYVAPIPSPANAPDLNAPNVPAPELIPDAPPPARAADARVKTEREEAARIRGYRAKVAGKTYQIVRGDYHRHTEISPDGGGDGPLVDMFRYAIDAANQDWICAGDHDYGNGREYTWWLIQKLDDAYHLGSNFVPVFGYERSVRYPDGHRNVMFVQRGIRSLPRLAGGQGNGVAPGDTRMLYKYLRQFDGICASHTSATDMGTDWRDNDPQLEPVVEIYQGDRQNYEAPGAPRANTAQDSQGGFQPAGYVWNALAKGYRLGFQSSSDHISTHISYSMAFVEKNSRAAIEDAFKRRHTYGATDNIIVDIRSGEQMMGDEFDSRQAPRLHIMAIGTQSSKIARVHIVKDNRVVHTALPNNQKVDMEWMDNEAKAGTSYYYVRIEQDDGQIAWASPMWIHYKP